ncbi:hypothetical protein HK100_003787, partial [Physocladia obscura]
MTEGQPASDDPALWKTILFDSACKFGETNQKIGYCVPDGIEITNETKYESSFSEKNIKLCSNIYTAIRSLVSDSRAVSIMDETDAVFTKSVAEVLQ